MMKSEDVDTFMRVSTACDAWHNAYILRQSLPESQPAHGCGMPGPSTTT